MKTNINFYKWTCKNSIHVLCCLLLSVVLFSCVNHEGTATYTYEDSGLYLTIDVQDYYRSRLYLSDKEDIYGANYVDINCPLDELDPGIFICFKSGDPKSVNIIDCDNRVTGIQSSDIAIQVSSHLVPERKTGTRLLEYLGYREKTDNDSDQANERPYMWHETAWWGDSTMFVNPYLIYRVADYLDCVIVYKKNYDDGEKSRLGPAKVVKYKFSWKIFFDKIAHIFVK